MTPGQLREYLSTVYDIICFEDMATVCSTAYHLQKILLDNRKSTFHAHERLVFFSKHELDESLLQHIKQTSDACDISLGFVLLVCPYDIQQCINSICPTDDKLQHLKLPVDGGELSKNYLSAHTICPLPWMHLEINNIGDIKPCCFNKNILGSVIDNDISEVFHGSDIQSLRQSLMSGVQDPSCISCWKVENSGGTSMRQEMIKWHQEKFFKRFIDHPQLESLDIKAGNYCNFKCRICNEVASSSIATEKIKHETDPNALVALKSLQRQGHWFEHNLNGARDKITACLNTVTQLDFYGGEPFLSKSIASTLDHIISTGRAPEVKLHFNTNASVFPKRWIEKLDSFQMVDIAISVDDIGERFEVTRGGDWQEICANIDQFRSLNRDQFNVYFYVTVSVLNVYYLDELLDWADSIGMRVLLNFVNGPEYLSIENLTLAAENLIRSKYQATRDQRLQVIVNRIKAVHDQVNDCFVKQSMLVDKHRLQDLRKTHNEIATAMGYV